MDASTPGGTPDTPSPASEARAERALRSESRRDGRVIGAAVFREVLAGTPGAIAAAARALRIADPIVGAMRAGETPLHFGDLFALPASIACALADRVIDFHRTPVRQHLAPDQHVARLAAELGDVAGVVLGAARDGRIDPQERRAIGRELRQLITAAEAALRDCDTG